MALEDLLEIDHPQLVRLLGGGRELHGGGFCKAGGLRQTNATYRARARPRSTFGRKSL